MAPFPQPLLDMIGEWMAQSIVQHRTLQEDEDEPFRILMQTIFTPDQWRLGLAPFTVNGDRTLALVLIASVNNERAAIIPLFVVPPASVELLDPNGNAPVAVGSPDQLLGIAVGSAEAN